MGNPETGPRNPELDKAGGLESGQGTGARENIEKSPLEWGSDLGFMSWDDAQIKIAELNVNLTEGENKWRLPTKDELLDEFNKTGSIPSGFKPTVYMSIYRDPLSLKNKKTVLSTEVCGVSMFYGDVIYNGRSVSFLVRLVRDAA